ncbi:hypothetical protein KPL25_07090 [Clostridium algidicarnis]|nr:hypothetical protein [Clostridium algidicarnis]MBU3193727.1 hypothetical protein [Clostridium algidicarnis]
MRKFAEEYKQIGFVQEVLAQITWYHNITLIEKIKDKDMRDWYVNKTIENGWSRNTLVHQLESNLFERQVSVETTANFLEKLYAPNEVFNSSVYYRNPEYLKYSYLKGRLLA